MSLQTDKKSFVLSLAIVIILFALFFVFFIPVFFTNDDVVMMMIASGTGLGSATPDEHLLFINVIIGFLLKRLYGASPYFPWYGLFDFSILFLSTVALLYAVLKRKFSITRLFFFLLFFITVELYFLVNTQFTFTSYLAGAAGVFLFLSTIEEEKPLLPLAFSLFLLIVSSLVRKEAFYMALLLGAPLISIKFVKNINSKIVIRYAVFLVTLIVISAGFLHYQNSQFKNNPKLRNVPKIMSATADFMDYSKARYSPETKHIFDEVGWSQNDFNMLLRFFRADEEVFSLEKMRKVLAHFPSHKSFRIKRVLTFVKRESLHRNEYVIFFAVLAFFFLCYARKDKLYITRVLATLGWMFVLMAYVIFYMYLKDRVYFSMISFMTFTTLFYADRDLSFHWPKERAVEKLKVVLLICLSALVIFVMGDTVYRLNDFSRHTHDVNLRFKRDMAKLNPSPEELYVVWANSFPYRLVLPFDNLKYLENLSLAGFRMASITDNKMKKFNIKNFSMDICKRNDIYIMISSLSQSYIYKTYMKEHYGLNIFFKPDARSGLDVFKVICY